MVYAGKLEAIRMAIIQTRDFITETAGCRIFTDSQPAIKSLAKPRRQSGQSIIKRILDEIDELLQTNPSYSLQLEWVPGHVGIEGNEKADQAAKHAACPPPSILLQRGPWQTTLRSAKANAIHQSIKRELQQEWTSGKGSACQLRHMTKSLKSNAKPPSRIYEKLGNKRMEIAWMARLRTGHCSLNGYLYRFHIVDDPTCDCGDAKETVRHLLLACPLHERERDRLRKDVGMGGMRLEKLLGDPRRVKFTIEFIENTGRFDF
jgi:ribonuclease HI